MRSHDNRDQVSILRLEPGNKRFESLLEGLLDGDPRATTALYDAFYDRISRLVWRLLGADPEHDDVVQQVFVSIMGSLDTIKDPTSLDRWIVGVTTNTVRNEIRRRKRRKLLRLDSEVSKGPHAPLDHDQQLFIGRFYRVLDTMGVEDRIVFSLRYVEEQRLNEIASACSCSLATVKRRLTRARQRFLKRAMKDFVLSSAIRDICNDA